MKEGWEVKKLGEVCDVVNGGTPDTTVKEFWNGVNLWITPKDMGKLNSIYVDNTERKITDAGLKNSSAKVLPINSVILSSRAPIGHLAINSKPISTNQGCKGLIPSGKINTLYLFYFLKKNVQLLNDLGSGTTFKELSGSKLSEVEIPIPPLPEQKRIVAILDEAFTAIDKAKENTEKNLQNAKELFQSELNSIFENKGKGWEERAIENLCTELFAGGDAPVGNFSKEKSEKYKIPIIANAVKDNGLYGFTDFARVTEPSITIAARGSGTGYTELRNEPYFPIVRLIVLIPNLSFISLEFLKYAIDTLEILRSGSAIPQLTIPMIKEYKIPLPSLSAQQKIVTKLNTLSIQTKKLERIYQQKLNALEELKKSILQEAFAVKLSVNVSVAKTIELPKSVPGISTTDLQIGLTIIALQKHIEKGKENTFHHVKAEKIINTVQYHLNIELDRSPVKDAAGPNDFPHVKKKIEPRAAKAGFYTVTKEDKGHYNYTLGRQANTVAEKAKTCLNDKLDTLNWLIGLMVPMSTEQAEIVATVYAAWNNLLIDGLPTDDEAIVKEARENWHEKKLDIPREKFFSAITWMKGQNLVPIGTGKKILAKPPGKNKK